MACVWTQLNTSLSQIRAREREQNRTAFDVPCHCVDGKDTTSGVSELILKDKRCPHVIRVMVDKVCNQSATNKNKWPVKKIELP